MKTLIIEDNHKDSELILIYLKKSELNGNMEYDTVSRLSEAQEKIQQNSYNAILLDLGLPDSKGIDTVKLMLQILNEHNKSCPIIVLTGDSDYAIGKQSIDAGADDFITKNNLSSKILGQSLLFFTSNKAVCNNK